MDSKPSHHSDEILKRRYIDGKSYKYLKKHLMLQGFSNNASVIKLKSVDNQFKTLRLKRAKKDLLIAIILISVPLMNFIIFYFDLVSDFRYKIGLIQICCILASRVFFLSYYSVVRDKDKF